MLLGGVYTTSVAAEAALLRGEVFIWVRKALREWMWLFVLKRCGAEARNLIAAGHLGGSRPDH